MLCLGQKKSLLSPRLVLTAQGMVQRTNDQIRVWYHSAIQAPLILVLSLSLEVMGGNSVLKVVGSNPSNVYSMDIFSHLFVVKIVMFV